jgi:hypothetical protein
MLKNDVVLNEGEAALQQAIPIFHPPKIFMDCTQRESFKNFKINFKNNQNKIFNTPFIQGESSQGMYSIDFLDDHLGLQ